MASKSSKTSVEVNSRLRGRSEILQQFTFFKKVNQLSISQKEIPQQSIYRQKSTVDVNTCGQPFTRESPFSSNTEQYFDKGACFDTAN